MAMAISYLQDSPFLKGSPQEEEEEEEEDQQQQMTNKNKNKNKMSSDMGSGPDPKISVSLRAVHSINLSDEPYSWTTKVDNGQCDSWWQYTSWHRGELHSLYGGRAGERSLITAAACYWSTLTPS